MDEKMLVLVICHNRFNNLAYWYKAWQKMDTTNAKLVFAITGHFAEHAYDPEIVEVVRMENLGLDIGCLQRFINTREDYDRLLWCPDDFLPLRHDVLNFYKSAEVVGTFWSIQICNHIRTGAIAMTKRIAKAIKFPPELLDGNNRGHCYRFEYGDYNFHHQVYNMGNPCQMVDGSVPPNCPYWMHVDPIFFLDTGQQPHLAHKLAWAGV